MRLMIVVAILVYVLLPVDMLPGPVDDIAVTIAGMLLAALTPPKGVENANH